MKRNLLKSSLELPGSPAELAMYLNRSISPRSVQLRFTAGDFWDPEEPIKIYFVIWIRKISMMRASVEESAAKTLKST